MHSGGRGGRQVPARARAGDRQIDRCISRGGADLELGDRCPSRNRLLQVSVDEAVGEPCADSRDRAAGDDLVGASRQDVRPEGERATNGHIDPAERNSGACVGQRQVAQRRRVRRTADRLSARSTEVRGARARRERAVVGEVAGVVVGVCPSSGEGGAGVDQEVAGDSHRASRSLDAGCRDRQVAVCEGRNALRRAVVLDGARRRERVGVDRRHAVGAADPEGGSGSDRQHAGPGGSIRRECRQIEDAVGDREVAGDRLVGSKRDSGRTGRRVVDDQVVERRRAGDRLGDRPVEVRGACAGGERTAVGEVAGEVVGERARREGGAGVDQEVAGDGQRAARCLRAGGCDRQVAVGRRVGDRLGRAVVLDGARRNERVRRVTRRERVRPADPEGGSGGNGQSSTHGRAVEGEAGQIERAGRNGQVARDGFSCRQRLGARPADGDAAVAPGSGQRRDALSRAVEVDSVARRDETATAGERRRRSERPGDTDGAGREGDAVGRPSAGDRQAVVVERRDRLGAGAVEVDGAAGDDKPAGREGRRWSERSGYADRAAGGEGDAVRRAGATDRQVAVVLRWDRLRGSVEVDRAARHSERRACAHRETAGDAECAAATENEDRLLGWAAR